MSFWNCVYTLLLMPLQILFEFVYNIAFKFIKDPGLTIVVLSITINLLVLPLYRKTDQIQEEERQIEAKLAKGIAHIKKTFRGDERTMMLQTYYRQNHYSPVHTLKSALSLFLEIPFFIAAYRFLSGLELLNGAVLGPIKDLGAPDALIHVLGISINLLPILMTAINIVTAALFTKGQPLKSKIQLYGMALVFLVLLYRSPAGLVFYWTLNNVFSLIKTLFYKMKNPRKVLFILSQVVGAGAFLAGVFFMLKEGLGHKVVLLMVVACAALVLLLKKRLDKKGIRRFKTQREPNTKLFILCSVFLAVLLGLLIPSSVIKSSVQEFIDMNYYVHPVWYLVSSLLLSVGTFVFWTGVFYKLASDRGKCILESFMLCFSVCAVIDYLFFAKNMGIISSDLRYENHEIVFFDTKAQILNLCVLIVAAAVILAVHKKWIKVPQFMVLVATLSISTMSVINTASIMRTVNTSELNAIQGRENTPHITLSRNGKNVIVLMLDRGMGEYIPFLFNEKPELKEQFSGFTYYSNTLSFGLSTNFAGPALYGGYEYTPAELNKRDTELLVDKHNEALKVMPVLFYENGYDVTVCDPSYAGYNWIPDLTIYNEYPEMKTYITHGYFAGTATREHAVKNRHRNFFCYGLMKIAPLSLQRDFYDNGNYNEPVLPEMFQVVEDLKHAKGLSSMFLDTYNVLTNLPFMTEVSDSDRNTFLMMSNETAHEPCLLQLPDFEPQIVVDNSAYDFDDLRSFTDPDIVLKMEMETQVAHYQVNGAAMVQLGNWFDYLKEQGVYDNTRIILVADHGRRVEQIDELILDQNAGGMTDVEGMFPLLMVKDFNAEGFKVSDEFMTNADVPTLSMTGIIKDPVNPFTGKAINSSEKTAHPQMVLYSEEWHTTINNGYTFLPGAWYSVHDSIWNKDNWTLVEPNSVLP